MELADEELLVLAVELDGLTEEARSAPWGELSPRGLEEDTVRTCQGNLTTNRPQQEAPESLVTGAAFDDLVNVNLAKTKLESARIERFLPVNGSPERLSDK